MFHAQSIKRKDDSKEVKVQMQFMVYGTSPSKDKSGAYLFLPDGKPKVYSPRCRSDVNSSLQKALIVSLGYPSHYVLLRSLGQESRQACCSFIFTGFKNKSVKDYFCLFCTIFSSFCLQSCSRSVLLQPYIQKEPPVVRVVEGPLFSEVVAHYQHFEQTVRIHNVPGTKHVFCKIRFF